MRSILIVLSLALGVAIVGCGKKSSGDDAPASNNAPAATHTTTARPCSGMVTDKDCAACCGAGYRSSFRGTGTCTCTK